MTTDSPESNRLLAEIGINEQHERAYRLLLARGLLAAHEVAAAMQLSTEQALAMLLELEGHGLIMCAPGAEPRFLPNTPEIAVEALILQRQAQLERTRAAITQLKREAQPLPQVISSPVELICGHAAVVRALGLVTVTARSELRCLTSAPLSGLVLTHSQGRARGARVLHVMDSGTAAGRAAFETLQERAAPEDECRRVPNVPLTAMIADRQLAWLPLQVDGTDPRALLVRPSPLLDGLLAMFDMLWNQAATLDSVAQVVPVAADSPGAFSNDLEVLIPLLTAGLNDKEIAHRLRISVRTLIRRVAKLLTVLDARSRFQAGWATALRLHGLTAPKRAHVSEAQAESSSKGANGNHTLQRSAH